MIPFEPRIRPGAVRPSCACGVCTRPMLTRTISTGAQALACQNCGGPLAPAHWIGCLPYCSARCALEDAPERAIFERHCREAEAYAEALLDEAAGQLRALNDVLDNARLSAQPLITVKEPA